jgi:putative DNA primase/helicase
MTGNKRDIIRQYVDGLRDHDLSQQEAAQMFLSGGFGQDHLFCRELGWLSWDGRRWSRDRDSDGIKKSVADWVQAQWEEFSRVLTLAFRLGIMDGGGEDDRMAKRLYVIKSGWTQHRNNYSLDGIVELAKLYSVKSLDEFDAHPELLNVGNGVLNLHTLELQPHDRGLLLTKLVEDEYHTDARSPKWAKALRAVPEDLRHWFQERVGLALIGGQVDEQEAVLLIQGTGRNGKNVVMEPIQHVLRDYFPVVPPSLLMNSGSLTPERAVLYGARGAWLNEWERDGSVKANTVKELTDATLHVNEKYKRPYTFATQFNLFVTSNNAPVIAGADDATWRRLVRITFPYTFVTSDEEADRERGRFMGDKYLKRDLKRGRTEREAILAWCVEGAHRALTNPTPTPPSVLASRNEWRDSTDTKRRFIAEHLVFDPNAYVSQKELYQVFVSFLQDCGLAAWSDRTLFAQLEALSDFVDRGVQRRKTKDSNRRSRHSSSMMDDPETAESYIAWHGIRWIDEVPTGLVPRVPSEKTISLGTSVPTTKTSAG